MLGHGRRRLPLGSSRCTHASGVSTPTYSVLYGQPMLFMVWVRRIELRLRPWQGRVRPLHNTHIVPPVGFPPTTPRVRTECCLYLSYGGMSMAPGARVELATSWLTARRFLPIELPRNKRWSGTPDSNRDFRAPEARGLPSFPSTRYSLTRRTRTRAVPICLTSFWFTKFLTAMLTRITYIGYARAFVVDCVLSLCSYAQVIYSIIVPNPVYVVDYFSGQKISA